MTRFNSPSTSTPADWDPGTLMTAKEVAAKLAISERMVWRLRAAGELKTLRLGRATRFLPEDIVRFIREAAKGVKQ